MVQGGVPGLDTPRTNLGDATYLTNQQLDFDISQEQSFQSPSKDNDNLIHQLQNGRRAAINLRTPRSRVVLSDRRNLPAGLGGGEFTPLLKSATRNSILRNGKENAIQTPAFHRLGALDNIPEDLTPLPVMGSSIYGDSRNASYTAATPIPHIDSSSTASTPLALLPRRTEGVGVLQDGNQLSLREQENVIDKIEKENFGLKLKIHFLEEALRKAGPGFGEAALKENTELKVDKVTMQKELYRYRKTLTAAERDVELYRQQILEMQEKVKRKHVDEGQREELDRLQQALEDKEAELDRLRGREGKFDDLEDKIQDLEAEVREKDRIISDREDEVDNLKDEVENHAETLSDLKEALKDAHRQVVEMEEKVQSTEELADAKETIQELERDMERFKNEAQEAKDDREEAARERDRAQADLEELQDEMANKSVTTKGLSRQIEEKANRLQDDLEDLREKHLALKEQHGEKVLEVKGLHSRIEDLKQEGALREQKLKEEFELVQVQHESEVLQKGISAKRLDGLQSELQSITDEKNLLQIRHDALTLESAGLQKELGGFRREVEDLEDKLEQERALAMTNEQKLKEQFKGEIEGLKDEIEDLRAEARQKEQLYDDERENWESDRRHIESQRDSAEQKAAGLQRTVDRLQVAEDTLSGKEMKVQEALQSEKDRHEIQAAALTRQITELNDDVQARRKALDDLRSELSDVREELRLSQREESSLTEKVQGLEDEVEILQATLEDESHNAKQEIASARAESESLQRQLRILKRDVANTEPYLDADAAIEPSQGDLQIVNGSKEQLSSRLRDVEKQLAQVRQDKQGLQDQLANVNIDVHSLRASKAEVEAEREEIKSQLRALKQQEETFHLDQERVNLRTAKIKLDGEVRRLRDENKVHLAQGQVADEQLRQEIKRASSEETRLNSLIRDLEAILRGSNEKRDLVAAKKTIQRLEERILELGNQVTVADNQIHAADELAIIRSELSLTRRKETEYLQREDAQQDVLRAFKRQIADLERKAHDTEISRTATQSPHASLNHSASKSEVIEVRHQLATAHQTLRELRAQLRDVEREAAHKANIASIDLQAQAEAWALEKDQLERSLDDAAVQKAELAAKASACEATITRLRGKIDRLEKALQSERLNSGEDRTIALERRDLHEMLRETQLLAESLEVVVRERDGTIANITAAESELRSQLMRIRDERAKQRSKAASAQEQLRHMERKYKKMEEVWETEKKALSRGVRFANMSLSVNDESEILELRRESHEREKRHGKELRGLAMQIEWLRARCRREEGLRANAAYAKRFMLLQIDLFEACNKADLRLLQQMGITPERTVHETKPTLRTVAFMIRATVRMRKGAEQWAKSRKIHERLVSSLEVMKRKARRIGSGH